jgi:putative tryptophan/tyrosine transport system substrate-binding protein
MMMVKRRTLIGAGGLCVVPLPSHAQPARKVYRVGILTVGLTAAAVVPQPQSRSTAAFLRGMRELGYVYGEHFVIEARGAGDKPERFPGLAAELARLDLDVIVGAGPSLRALKQATSTIPVVMAASGDPVSAGLVQSLAHPGGNFTGLSSQTSDSAGKRLELLKELIPGTAPVAVLWHRDDIRNWQAAQATARARGWKLLSIEIRDAGEIDAVFTAATDARASALFVHAPTVLQSHAGRFAELAVRHRLPTMYHQQSYVVAGGLMSYGADTVEIWHHAAAFVDKILKGAKPADLPVQQPTKFELVINLKTAKALGLAIPQSLLLRADEVIE